MSNVGIVYSFASKPPSLILLNVQYRDKILIEKPVYFNVFGIDKQYFYQVYEASVCTKIAHIMNTGMFKYGYQFVNLFISEERPRETTAYNFASTATGCAIYLPYHIPEGRVCAHPSIPLPCQSEG